MKRHLMTLTLMLAAALLLAVGCDDGESGVSGGNVTVQVSGQQASSAAPTTAAEGDSQVLVTFGYLALIKTDGTEEPLITGPDSEPVDITQEEPLGTFEVPPGEYSGIVLEIDDVQVVEEGAEGEERTCPSTNVDPVLETRWAVDRNEVWLTVDEEGTQSVLIELPVVGGSCATDGGTATLQVSPSGNMNIVIL